MLSDYQAASDEGVNVLKPKTVTFCPKVHHGELASVYETVNLSWADREALCGLCDGKEVHNDSWEVGRVAQLNKIACAEMEPKNAPKQIITRK